MEVYPSLAEGIGLENRQAARVAGVRIPLPPPDIIDNSAYKWRLENSLPHVTSFYFKTNHKVWCKAILSLLHTHIPMIIFIDMKGVNMDLIIQTFPLDGKTLYYVQCPVCKNNRILNSGANVSRIISDDTFRKLCGCTCDVKQTATKVEAPKS